MSTISTYKTLVQNEVDDASARAGALIERAIAETYQEILRLTLKYLIGSTEEDVTATVSQRYVSPATTYHQIDNVLWKTSGGTTWVVLAPITKREYYENYANNAAGDPAYYYVDGANIYFDVPASTAGTVRISGYAVQSELTGAVTSVIPDRYTNVLVLGSVARFKAYEGIDDAREYEKLYRGPYGSMGSIGGALGEMIRDLSEAKAFKPLLYGK